MSRGKFQRLLIKEAENNNSSVDKKIKKLQLVCAFCPPNKGENSTRKSKHGAKKPKYKDKDNK